MKRPASSSSSSFSLRPPSPSRRKSHLPWRIVLHELWAYLCDLRHAPNLVSAGILALWFQTELFGWGGTYYTDWRTGNDVVSAAACCGILFFIFLRLTHTEKGGNEGRSWFNRFPRGTHVLGFIALLLGALSPLYRMTGQALISAQNLDALLGTDAEETWSFLSSIPWNQWDLGMAAGLLICFLLRFTAPELKRTQPASPTQTMREPASTPGISQALRFHLPLTRDEQADPVDPSVETGALPDSTELLRRWRLFSWLALLVIPGVSPLMDIGAGFCRFSYLKYATPETTWHVTGELSTEGDGGNGKEMNAERPTASAGAPQSATAAAPSPVEGVTVSSNAPPASQARPDRSSRIRNYIIVMSESLSEKTMGLYGAPFNTTPFMSFIPTKRIETMVSPSLATAAAVSLFAARPNPQDPLHPHYEDNIITLAKEAGLRTYWVSSQGRMSAYEASISFIADQADVQFFVKKHDDFSLIPVIERIFSAPEPEGRGRLVFVHTYGAHEETCSRVTDVGRPFVTGAEEFLDCYLAAAYKQDLTVEAIARAAERSGESWSLIFTSDHAINFRRDDAGRLIAMRSADYKGQYEVPFVQMGAGVTETQVYRVVRSSTKFRDYFPTWIGVTTNQTPRGYDIFTNRADETNVSEASVLPDLDREEKDQGDQEDQGKAGNAADATDAVYVLRGNGEVRPYASLKRTPGMQEVVNGFTGLR